MSIEINEIFRSLQGETTTAGFPSVFIRLAGCNLRCAYCDTVRARERGSGSFMEIEEILGEVQKLQPFHHVTVTGGEPLFQDETPELVHRLVTAVYSVQVETNGSLPIKRLSRDCRRIVDVKCPSSMEAGSFLHENLYELTSHDELKFVVGTEEDYLFVRDFINRFLPEPPCVLNVSPVFGMMDCSRLVSGILEDGLPVRLNIQLHKLMGFS